MWVSFLSWEIHIDHFIACRPKYLVRILAKAIFFVTEIRLKLKAVNVIKTMTKMCIYFR